MSRYSPLFNSERANARYVASSPPVGGAGLYAAKRTTKLISAHARGRAQLGQVSGAIGAAGLGGLTGDFFARFDLRMSEEISASLKNPARGRRVEFG